MSENVLVVATHPDDETLGCGGVLLKHKNHGDKIYWLIMTNIHVENGWADEVVSQSQNEIAQVSKIYGFEKVVQLDFSTTMLDTVPYRDIVGKVSDIIQDIKPSVVYLPNQSDIHTDHKVTFNAAISCCKSFRSPFIKRVLMYECLSETEFAPALPGNAFLPNVFVDVSAHWQKKLGIFKIYGSEQMPSPLPRSLDAIEALSRFRGSSIGVEFAEAFMLLKEKA